MLHVLKSALWIFTLTLLAVLSTRPAAALVIGTFDASRAGAGNIAAGDFTHSVVSTINTQFPGSSFVTFPTITSPALTGVDILMIAADKSAADPITELSASEQSAMLDFVKAGGRALILADAWGNHVPASQSMVGPFGLTVVDDGLTGVQLAQITNPTHPVINGPFGSTSQIGLYGAGNFTSLGPSAVGLANELATGLPVAAAIEAHALSSTSGRVVLYTDTQMYIDSAMQGFFPTHMVLFQNTMAYLAPVPEPGSLAMMAAALAGLAIVAHRRRRR